MCSAYLGLALLVSDWATLPGGQSQWLLSCLPLVLLASHFSSPACFFQNQHFDGFVVEVWSQLLSQKHV